MIVRRENMPSSKVDETDPLEPCWCEDAVVVCREKLTRAQLAALAGIATRYKALKFPEADASTVYNELVRPAEQLARLFGVGCETVPPPARAVFMFRVVSNHDAIGRMQRDMATAGIDGVYIKAVPASTFRRSEAYAQP